MSQSENTNPFPGFWALEMFNESVFWLWSIPVVDLALDVECLFFEDSWGWWNIKRDLKKLFMLIEIDYSQISLSLQMFSIHASSRMSLTQESLTMWNEVQLFIIIHEWQTGVHYSLLYLLMMFFLSGRLTQSRSILTLWTRSRLDISEGPRVVELWSWAKRKTHIVEDFR